jgi:fructosamine-3-kinase
VFEPLRNPERTWERAEGLTTLDPEEIVSRVGDPKDGWEVLTGGHANLNIRLGRDRVLRIYRRDRTTLDKELALLRRPWRSFQLPKVYAVGGDFLLIEYVHHQPLEATADAGSLVGRALAELHQTRFAKAGELNE